MTDERLDEAVSGSAAERSNEQPPRRARLLSNIVIVVVLGGYCAVNFPTLLEKGYGPGLDALAIGTVLALLMVYLGYFTRRLNSRRFMATSMLILLAVLAYAPLLVFGQEWTSMASFLAGGVLVVLRRYWAYAVFGLVVVSIGVVQAVLTGSLLDIVYTSLTTAVFGLEFYLFTWLARSATELFDTREEMIEKAVSEQRLHFESDLEDLLGLTLSAITLKGELVHRLLVGQQERARVELTNIAKMTRRALVDVRAMASGYRDISVPRASRIAEDLLAMSDIEVRLDIDLGVLPDPVRAALTSVLRTCLTRILRVDATSSCELAALQSAHSVSLEVFSDVEPDPLGMRELDALRAKVVALGGRLDGGPQPDGRYLVRAQLPLARGERSAGAEGTTQSRSIRLGVDSLRVTVFIGLALSPIVHLLYLTTDAVGIGMNVACIACLLAIQLGYFSRPGVLLRAPRSHLLLLAQAVLVFLPISWLGGAWVSSPSFLVGSLLLVLPLAWGAALSTLTVASVVAIGLTFDAVNNGPVFNAVSVVISGLAVFGLTWLGRLLTQLEQARDRLRAARIADERLRFTRDLHDLLGLSLSAIALKSELTSKLVVLDRTRALGEAAELLDLARGALSEVRSVVTGRSELSLERESQAVRTTLVAAGVRVEMDLEYAELPADTQTVLAVVLREGVTNVLRHSDVEQCDITVRSEEAGVRMNIINDGVDLDRDRRSPGNGIRNLSARVAELGGRLSAEERSDGTFQLCAVVPV